MKLSTVKQFYRYLIVKGFVKQDCEKHWKIYIHPILFDKFINNEPINEVEPHLIDCLNVPYKNKQLRGLDLINRYLDKYVIDFDVVKKANTITEKELKYMYKDIL